MRHVYDLARHGDGRPFLLVASFIHPHDPYVARPEWWDLYAHDAIDLPEAPPEVLEPHVRRIRQGIEADSVGYSEAQCRNARHGYYANTSYFDSWLGRLVDALGEVGELDRTVVIATSDHGDMLGDRGTWFKMCFYERSARVPLVVAGPDVVNRTVGNACSLLDLFPTLLDIAGDGTEPAAPLVGRSLWPSATGGEDPVDETIAEYTAEMTSHPMFMIRRGRHKYIACETDPPLLYDVGGRSVGAHEPGHRSRARRSCGRLRGRGGGALGRRGDQGGGARLPTRPPRAARGHGCRQPARLGLRPGA